MYPDAYLQQQRESRPRAVGARDPAAAGGPKVLLSAAPPAALPAGPDADVRPAEQRRRRLHVRAHPGRAAEADVRGGHWAGLRGAPGGHPEGGRLCAAVPDAPVPRLLRRAPRHRPRQLLPRDGRAGFRPHPPRGRQGGPPHQGDGEEDRDVPRPQAAGVSHPRRPALRQRTSSKSVCVSLCLAPDTLLRISLLHRPERHTTQPRTHTTRCWSRTAR